MSRKHEFYAQKCCRQLAEYFPQGGIGITGSVAKGLATEQSDIDLVVVLKDKVQPRHGVCQTEGLLINVQVLNLQMLQNKKDAAYTFMPFLPSYLRHATIFQDADGSLAEAIAWAEKQFSDRQSNSVMIAEHIATLAFSRGTQLKNKISPIEQQVLAANMAELFLQRDLCQAGITAESTISGCRDYLQYLADHPQTEATTLGWLENWNRRVDITNYSQE